MPRPKSSGNGSGDFAAILGPAIDRLKIEQASLQKQLNRVNELLDTLTKEVGGSGAKLGRPLGATASVAGGTGKGKRIRRSPEQLQADAMKIVKFLKENPGSKAGAIQKGTKVNYGLSLKEFISKNTDHKLKTTGELAGMVYSVA